MCPALQPPEPSLAADQLVRASLLWLQRLRAPAAEPDANQCSGTLLRRLLELVDGEEGVGGGLAQLAATAVVLTIERASCLHWCDHYSGHTPRTCSAQLLWSLVHPAGHSLPACLSECHAEETLGRRRLRLLLALVSQQRSPLLLMPLPVAETAAAVGGGAGEGQPLVLAVSRLVFELVDCEGLQLLQLQLLHSYLACLSGSDSVRVVVRSALESGSGTSAVLQPALALVAGSWNMPGAGGSAELLRSCLSHVLAIAQLAAAAGELVIGQLVAVCGALSWQSSARLNTLAALGRHVGARRLLQLCPGLLAGLCSTLDANHLVHVSGELFTLVALQADEAPLLEALTRAVESAGGEDGGSVAGRVLNTHWLAVLSERRGPAACRLLHQLTSSVLDQQQQQQSPHDAARVISVRLCAALYLIHHLLSQRKQPDAAAAGRSGGAASAAAGAAAGRGGGAASAAAGGGGGGAGGGADAAAQGLTAAQLVELARPLVRAALIGWSCDCHSAAILAVCSVTLANHRALASPLAARLPVAGVCDSVCHVLSQLLSTESAFTRHTLVSQLRRFLSCHTPATQLVAAAAAGGGGAGGDCCEDDAAGAVHLLTAAVALLTPGSNHATITNCLLVVERLLASPLRSRARSVPHQAAAMSRLAATHSSLLDRLSCRLLLLCLHTSSEELALQTGRLWHQLLPLLQQRHSAPHPAPLATPRRPLVSCCERGLFDWLREMSLRLAAVSDPRRSLCAASITRLLLYHLSHALSKPVSRPLCVSHSAIEGLSSSSSTVTAASAAAGEVIESLIRPHLAACSRRLTPAEHVTRDSARSCDDCPSDCPAPATLVSIDRPLHGHIACLRVLVCEATRTFCSTATDRASDTATAAADTTTTADTTATTGAAGGMCLSAVLVCQCVETVCSVVSATLSAVACDDSGADYTSPSFADIGRSLLSLAEAGPNGGAAGDATAASNRLQRHLLAHYWLNLKECCCFIADWADTYLGAAVSRGASAPGSQRHRVPLLVSTLRRVLTKSRHKGAIESAGAAWSRLCSALVGHQEAPVSRDLFSLHVLPELERVLQVLEQSGVVSAAEKADGAGAGGRRCSVTRRGAGLPLLVLGVLSCSDWPGHCRLLDATVARLLALAATPVTAPSAESAEQLTDLPQTDALYTVTVLVSGGLLHSQQLQPVTQLALQLLTHPCWQLRNASLVLFGALVPRLVGQKKSRHQRRLNSVTALEFFARWPALLPALLAFLPAGGECDAAETEAPPAAQCAVLSLLTRLSPPGPTALLVTPLLRLLSSRYWSLRRLAAAALAAILPEPELLRQLSVGCKLLASETADESDSGSAGESVSKTVSKSVSHNTAHGYLLLVSSALQCNTSDTLSAQLTTAVASLLHSALSSPLVHCPPLSSLAVSLIADSAAISRALTTHHRLNTLALLDQLLKSFGSSPFGSAAAPHTNPAPTSIAAPPCSRQLLRACVRLAMRSPAGRAMLLQQLQQQQWCGVAGELLFEALQCWLNDSDSGYLHSHSDSHDHDDGDHQQQQQQQQQQQPVFLSLDWLSLCADWLRVLTDSSLTDSRAPPVHHAALCVSVCLRVCAAHAHVLLERCDLWSGVLTCALQLWRHTHGHTDTHRDGSHGFVSIAADHLVPCAQLVAVALTDTTMHSPSHQQQQQQQLLLLLLDRVCDTLLLWSSWASQQLCEGVECRLAAAVCLSQLWRTAPLTLSLFPDSAALSQFAVLFRGAVRVLAACVNLLSDDEFDVRQSVRQSLGTSGAARQSWGAVDATTAAAAAGGAAAGGAAGAGGGASSDGEFSLLVEWSGKLRHCLSLRQLSLDSASQQPVGGESTAAAATAASYAVLTDLSCYLDFVLIGLMLPSAAPDVFLAAACEGLNWTVSHGFAAPHTDESCPQYRQRGPCHVRAGLDPCIFSALFSGPLAATSPLPPVYRQQLPLAAVCSRCLQAPSAAGGDGGMWLPVLRRRRCLLHRLLFCYCPAGSHWLDTLSRLSTDRLLDLLLWEGVYTSVAAVRQLLHCLLDTHALIAAAVGAGHSGTGVQVPVQHVPGAISSSSSTTCQSPSAEERQHCVCSPDRHCPVPCYLSHTGWLHAARQMDSLIDKCYLLPKWL